MRKAVITKAQTETLTNAEVQRLGDRLAGVFITDVISGQENLALLTLLFDHLNNLQDQPAQFSITIDTIKRSLFSPTEESTQAQKRFQDEAYRNRGKLLQFPSERKERV